MSESKYIEFAERPLPSGRKTRAWTVVSKDNRNGRPLGFVAWYAAWRCYGFYPAEETVFEQQCLRDIAQFCDERTAAHRINLREQHRAHTAGHTLG